jgi:uncharacterized BrkB/YihY/UPF0761 family membrane protein
MESTVDYTTEYSVQPPDVGGCLLKLIGLLLVLGLLGVFVFGLFLGSFFV